MKNILSGVSFVGFIFIQCAFIDVYALDDILDQQTLEFSDSYDKRLRYTPSTVVILDREYIENSGALTVAELLERVVGIHMTRKSYGASSNQYIRGIDSNLLVLHNGVENAKLIPELLSMPVMDLERVEVLKGSHYPLYGASAVVGTINLVTSSIKEDTTVIGVRGGTLDSQQISVRRSDKKQQLGYSAYISHTKTDSTKGVIQSDLQSLLDQIFGSALSLAPRDGFFGAEFTDARLTLEFGDHWTLHQLVNHRKFGTGVGLSQVLDPDGEENVVYYSADGDFEARLTYNYVDMTYRDLTAFQPGAFGGIFPDGVKQRRYNKTGDDIFVEGLYRIVKGKNTLDIGAGGSYGRLENGPDIRNFRFVPGGQIPVEPLGGFFDLSSTEPLFGGDITFRRGHLMLRDEYKITNNLFFNAGGRVDYSSEIGTHLVPRIGIDWIAGQYTNIGLLYGESVQAPSQVTQTSQGLYFAQGDTGLESEKIQLLEFSLDHEFNNSFSVITNVYTFKLTDTIAIVNDPDAPNGTRFANLSDNENGTGAEFVLKWNLNSNTNITAGLSSVDVQSADQSIATSPRLEPYLEINHKARSGFNANVAVISVGDRERRIGDDRPPISDYTILNATITKADLLIQGLGFSFSVQNLFDADSREDIAPIIVSDLPVYPRRVLAGLSYKYD